MKLLNIFKQKSLRQALFVSATAFFVARWVNTAVPLHQSIPLVLPLLTQ